MTLWRPLQLLLPKKGFILLAATAAGKRCLTQPRPRPMRGARVGRRRVAIGGAAATLGCFGLSAFSLFSQEAEKEEEGGKGGEEEPKEAKQEEAIIFLLKKAKLNIMKGEMEEAERILHEAARMAQKAENTAGLIYTYDTMANLALSRGQMEQAEKLFKATMSHLLAGNMKEDDNAVLEISLKLASIYAAQNQDKLALAGYEFCILTLEEKVARQKDQPQDSLPEEERKDTRLLLGLSLDSYARFLLAWGRASAAQKMYNRALRIAAEEQGETHPQTVVLMSDLATALDSQGLYEEAYVQAKRAAELAKETEHPEAHIVLNNLAGILMHKEDYSGAKRVYHEALKRAEKSGDDATAKYIRKELLELAKRRKRRSESSKEKSREEAGRQ
ncbi:tetratricopeptide repeat protein 19, mitochondrial [Anolis sagrei]|uniref:tetratricopeptide repeat protein 19, mitochondrial n=1 Tax=Anolis sagrei TaxID=38937 RepID=UPI00351FD760